MAKRDAIQEPPNSTEAEEYVLGALMLPGTTFALDAVPEIIQPKDFYRDSHRRIYEGCLALYAAGSEVDAITVIDWLDANGSLADVGGPDRIRELATVVPAVSVAPHHARVMRDVATRRGLIGVGADITRLGWDLNGADPNAALSEAERLVFDLSQTRGRSRGDLTPAREVADETYRLLEELYNSDRQFVGLPSGFRQLDYLTGGFRPGQLVIVAARPSMGKTALALGMTSNVVLADEPVPVALFSLEMTKIEAMQRLVASASLVDSQKVQNPRKLPAEDYRRITTALGRFAESPLWIDESGAVTMADIRSKVRRLKLRQPELGLVVIDYVQLMTAGVRADNRNAELSLISRSMKLLAVELGIPILILSQLNRSVEERHDKRPMLSDLRDSGALEQDADIVMLLYREEYYYPDEDDAKGIAEINIAKQRNGPVGVRKLAFRDSFARFTDLHATESTG